MRTLDVAMRTSEARVHQPWQVSRDGDYNSSLWRGRYIREVQPQDARSIKFSKTCRYRVTSTLARRQWLIFESQQFSWLRILPESLPRGRVDSCCNYHFKTSFKPETYV